MDVAFLQSKIPLLSDWITKTLSDHSSQAKPVTSCNFQRLIDYYSPQRLSRTKFVVVKQVPIPPLTAMGLNQFAAFEQTPFWGITYKDTYFIRAEHALSQAIHFHELVHVIQWARLGVDTFLLVYAKGLLEHGYEHSPLEAMAYRHQKRFESDPKPYNVEGEVLGEIEMLQRSMA